MSGYNFTPKTAKFFCEKCDFKCNKESDWKRHIITRKHNKNDYGETILHRKMPKPAMYECNHCGNTYMYRQGLFKHKKTCIPKELSIPNENDKELDEKDKEILRLKGIIEGMCLIQKNMFSHLPEDLNTKNS